MAFDSQNFGQANSKTFDSRILALADQPWQSLIMSEYLNSLLDVDSKTHAKLFIADYYSVLHDKRFLKSIKDASKFEILDYENLFRSWQEEFIPSLEESQKIIDAWYCLYKPKRTMEQIFQTNQLVYGWERQFYYLPLSQEWKLKIFADTITYCEQLIKSFNPHLVIGIERVNFSFNIIFEMCQSLCIPYLLISQSRIGNRWSYRLDFGLGNDKPLFVLPPSCKASAQHVNPSVESFIEDYRNRSLPAYISNASRLSQIFSSRISQRFFIAFFGDLQNGVISLRPLVKKLLLRIIHRRKHYSFKVKRLEQNLFKLSLWELRQAITLSLRLLGFKLWGKSHLECSSKYLLWCLHSRPEDSTSVLGLGFDEIQLILYTLEKLPEDTFLVIKEHPLMLGLRHLGFYRTLKQHSRVILVDPFADTQSLLRNNLCYGTIGLSGTFLLESIMLEKGAFAFGVPEFGYCLDSNGLSLQEYLNGKRLEKTNRLKHYLSIIFLNSEWSDPAYLCDWSLDEKKVMFSKWQTISKQIFENLA